MLVEILRESFEMLLRKPRLFIPKIVSTLTASLFLIFLLSSRTALTALDPLLLLSGVTLVTILLSVMGVYSSMMLSSMVKNSGGLRSSFDDVRTRLKPVIGAAMAVLLLSFLLSGIVIAGYYTALITGSYMFLGWAVFTAVLITLAASYAIYFLPITLLEEKNLVSAIGASHSASRENRIVVFSLLVFSLALMAVAVFSSGYLEKLGYAGFVAGRLVSSIVNTYIFVVSPTYYLESGSENVD